jgi:hypothetical protein
MTSCDLYKYFEANYYDEKLDLIHYFVANPSYIKIENDADVTMCFVG